MKSTYVLDPHDVKVILPAGIDRNSLQAQGWIALAQREAAFIGLTEVFLQFGSKETANDMFCPPEESARLKIWKDSKGIIRIGSNTRRHDVVRFLWLASKTDTPERDEEEIIKHVNGDVPENRIERLFNNGEAKEWGRVVEKVGTRLYRINPSAKPIDGLSPKPKLK